MSTSKSGSVEITRLLRTMNESGGYPISIVTDRHGFPIAAAAGQNEDPDTQSAVVALVQKTATQASQQLGMARTDEISMFDDEGRRLVCRPFEANGHQLILAVSVPDRRQAYRRLTNQTVRQIQRIWKL